MTARYDPYDFATLRHVGPTRPEIDAMPSIVCAASLEGPIDDTLPP